MGLLSTAARTVADWVKLGYPESVAKRIVSGDLPMDEASRLKRAEEQGYLSPVVRGKTRLYHGTDGDYGNLEPSVHDEYPVLSVDTTPDPDYASGYAENRYGRRDEIGNPVVYPLLMRGRVSDEGDVMSLLSGIDEDAFYEMSPEEVTDYLAQNGVKSFNAFGGSDEVSVLDPSILRSPNAAFDPEYTGRNILGGVALPATAGLLALGQSEDADAGFVSKGGKTLLEAWHGSPHKFDKFSMDQIGTGEGAQAYGHGLYFADEIDVAKGYQPRDRGNEEWMYDQYKAAEEAGDQYMMDAWERAMMHESPIELRASAADPDYDEYSQAAFAEVADLLEANPGSGSLSKVEIDVTPESLLDWDKPLSEQSDYVRALLSDNAGINSDKIMSRIMDGGDSDGFALLKDGDGYTASADNAMFYEAKDFETKEEAVNWLNEKVSKYAEGSVRGSDVYRSLTNEAGSDGIGQAVASNQLRDKGIKGIKYLDGNSRGAGDGTSNYVIFDDSLINIAERGRATPGMMATVAGTAGGASGIAALRDEVLNQLAAAKTVKERGDIRAPNSETLHKVTMAARDLERRLEGHPAGWLFPGGMLEYLEQANREERPSAMTRAMAFLDVL